MANSKHRNPRRDTLKVETVTLPTLEQDPRNARRHPGRRRPPRLAEERAATQPARTWPTAARSATSSSPAWGCTPCGRSPPHARGRRPA